MNNRYLKSQRISLEKNTQLDKSWVKQKLPMTLPFWELGDLVVRDIDEQTPMPDGRTCCFRIPRKRGDT